MIVSCNQSTPPDRSAVLFQCTSMHFNDTLLLKHIALHSQVCYLRTSKKWAINGEHNFVFCGSVYSNLVNTSLCSVVYTAPTLQCSSACSICSSEVLQCTEVLHCTAMALPLHCRCAGFRPGSTPLVSGRGNNIGPACLLLTAKQGGNATW